MNQNFDRRNFLKLTAGSIAAAAGLGVAGNAVAQQKLTPDDPAAKALHYAENAASVQDPAHKAGSHCANCALYQAAAEKNGFAPCGAFAGKLVAAKGWCMAWAAKG